MDRKVLRSNQGASDSAFAKPVDGDAAGRQTVLGKRESVTDAKQLRHQPQKKMKTSDGSSTLF